MDKRRVALLAGAAAASMVAGPLAASELPLDGTEWLPVPASVLAGERGGAEGDQGGENGAGTGRIVSTVSLNQSSSQNITTTGAVQAGALTFGTETFRHQNFSVNAINTGNNVDMQVSLTVNLNLQN